MFALNSTRLGKYDENCGLSHITMSWGHDGRLTLKTRHKVAYYSFSLPKSNIKFNPLITHI